MKTDILREQLCKIPFIETVYYDDESCSCDKNVGIYVHTLKQGGSQRAVELLLKRLKAHNYGVFVISPVDGEYAGILAEKYGANVFVIDEKGYLSGSARDILLHFDFVVLNSFCSTRFAYYYLNTETPCIWWIHEGVEVTEQSIKNMDPIFVGSKNFVYAFPWPKPMNLWKNAFPDVQTFFLPIEVEDCSDNSTETPVDTGDRVRYLIPGAYNPHKGFHTAVQAFLIMEANGYTDYEAVFCGYDNCGEYYDIIENACSGRKNIKILGELTKEELYKQMAGSDCVIVPSIFDAGPLTAVEALMHGKLLIVSDKCGISEYIEDCENGFVYTAEDASDLFKKVSYVYQDRARLNNVSERGRKLYERYFSKNVMDEAFEDLMDIVSGGKE